MKKSSPKKITLKQVETFKTTVQKAAASQEIDFNTSMEKSRQYPQILMNLQQKLNTLEKSIRENMNPDYTLAKKEISELNAQLSPIQVIAKGLPEALNTMSKTTIPAWREKMGQFQAQMQSMPEVAADFKEHLEKTQQYIAQVEQYLSKINGFLEEIMPMLQPCTAQIERLEQHINTAQVVKKTDESLSDLIKRLELLNKLAAQQFQELKPELQTKALQFGPKLRQAQDSLPAWMVPQEMKGETYVASRNGIA